MNAQRLVDILIYIHIPEQWTLNKWISVQKERKRNNKLTNTDFFILYKWQNACKTTHGDEEVRTLIFILLMLNHFGPRSSLVLYVCLLDTNPHLIIMEHSFMLMKHAFNQCQRFLFLIFIYISLFFLFIFLLFSLLS